MISCFLVLGIAALAGIGYFFFTGMYTYQFTEEHYRVVVYSYRSIFETDEKFLSVALDTSFMGCFFHYLDDRKWEKLQEMSSFLSPAYLRLGGNQADELLFVEEDTISFKKYYSCALNDSLRGRLVITGDDWIKINNFSRNAGFDFLMDLNVLLRSGPNWNSSNAEKLIDFSQKRNISLNFQLGNEPNSFPHVFNISLSASQLAKDFNKLRSILNSTEAYKNSLLVGPDVTRPKNLEKPSLAYLKEFLYKVKNLDAASWHHYYLNGRTAKLEDFLDVKVFNEFPPQVKAVVQTVTNVSRSLPVWLSETSSAYGGGVPYLSDRFVASFLWLDKLGIAAKSNISVVIRQSLFKNYYALISPRLTPSPDFWISFFYKNLVGGKVLKTLSYSPTDAVLDLRFYAHCLAPNALVNGSVVVYGMNLMNTTQLVVVKGIIYGTPVQTFTFRAENYNLRSRTMLLNEKPLTYDPENMYELLKTPKLSTLPLTIPQYSIVFWIFNELINSTCNT